VAKLTPSERDLLERITEKEELRPFFFKKAKDLKWFDFLAERGYFEPDQNPKPEPAGEEGFIKIPFWPATEYLVSSSVDLSREENRTYAEKYLEIIRSVTQHAVDLGYSNYRTWWQFSKVIQNLPPDLIRLEDIALINYWLEDRYERNLVGREIGEKWLVFLLDHTDQHCKYLAKSLISSLYDLKFQDRQHGQLRREMAVLRFNTSHSEEITAKIAVKAGKVLGLEAVQLFHDRLETILGELGNDKWSSIWRPAIEDHSQNVRTDDAQNILVNAFRDSLIGFVENYLEQSSSQIKIFLESRFETIKRINIYILNRHYRHLYSLADVVLVPIYFSSNFRHELWMLLRNHYRDFSDSLKRRVLDIILNLNDISREEQISEAESAYYKAIWLSAIKDAGKDTKELYEYFITKVGSEPEHPDFSSYIRVGPLQDQPPYQIEELLSWEVDELVKHLDAFTASYNSKEVSFTQRGLRGLVIALHQAIKAEPIKFYAQIHTFSDLDFAFVYEIIEAYDELWTQKLTLPWDQIWGHLLNFCEGLIKQERFWRPESAKTRSDFVGNSNWVVSAIGRLITNGTRSDEHSFSDKLLPKAEAILEALINGVESEEFKPDSDAVFLAINSPRGICIEGLFNLTLRSCRLSDKETGNHRKTWDHFQPIYTALLANGESGKYEFATLVANYLPNFLYMSQDWVLANLNNIFDLRDYQKWLCAMQGYSYVDTIYQEIFGHFKKEGHFIRALDDENLREQVKERIVENVTVAFINDFEELEDENSLINQLIVRTRPSEIGNLIWFMWSLRNDSDQKIRTKVFKLWPRILDAIDTRDHSGRLLASKLCTWAVFVDVVNDTNKPLILSVAEYADEEHNSSQLLESIARISLQQPLEAYDIWDRMLLRSQADYPAEAIRTALINIAKVGAEGIRMAKGIVSQYLRVGIDEPSKALREIMRLGKTSEYNH
jgi:hypothetical protein